MRQETERVNIVACPVPSNYMNQCLLGHWEQIAEYF